MPSAFTIVRRTLRLEQIRRFLRGSSRWEKRCEIDWLGDDRSVPIGIRALWPFSDAYFQAGVRWFPPVERRYWLPGFWTANLHAIGWELVSLSPLVILALAARARKPRRADGRT